MLKELCNGLKSHPSHFAKGSSLLEVVIALGILSLLSLSLTGGLVQMKKMTSQSQTLSLVDQQVFNFIQQIQQNPNLYQKYTKNSTLDSQDGVTLAWTQQQILAVEDCPHCPGRFTYLITPEQGTTHNNFGRGGLYKVNVRVTHQEWGAGTHKDYFFFIREKIIITERRRSYGEIQQIF